MQWTVRLETTTSAWEVKSTELVTFSRPAVVSTLAGGGLMLAETKTLLGVSKIWGATPRVGLLGGQTVRPAPPP